MGNPRGVKRDFAALEKRRFGAVKLFKNGMSVVGVGRDPAKLKKLEAEIGDPSRIATISVDIASDEAPQSIVNLALERFGGITYLVNNAGLGSPKPLHETDDAMLDEFLGVMLRAPFQPTCASGRSALSLNGISSVSATHLKWWPMYLEASVSMSSLYLLAA